MGSLARAGAEARPGSERRRPAAGRRRPVLSTGRIAVVPAHSGLRPPFTTEERIRSERGFQRSSERGFQRSSERGFQRGSEGSFQRSSERGFQRRSERRFQRSSGVSNGVHGAVFSRSPGARRGPAGRGQETRGRRAALDYNNIIDYNIIVVKLCVEAIGAAIRQRARREESAVFIIMVII